MIDGIALAKDKLGMRLILSHSPEKGLEAVLDDKTKKHFDSSSSHCVCSIESSVDRYNCVTTSGSCEGHVRARWGRFI